MERERIFKELLNGGILVEDQGVHISDKYTAFGAQNHSQYSVREFNSIESDVDVNLQELYEIDNGLKHKWMYIYQATSLSSEEALKSLVIVENMIGGNNKLEGTPDGFIPIDMKFTNLSTQIFDNFLLYAWRLDCPTCEEVKTSLEKIGFPSESIVGLSVFGPDNPQFLKKEYQIHGGPTILFFKGGEIDVRLVGEVSEHEIKNEIENTYTLLPNTVKQDLSENW